MAGTNTTIISHTVTGRQSAPKVTLQTFKGPLETGGPTSALVTSLSEDETVYIVNGPTGEVDAYKGDSAPSFRSFARTIGPIAIRSH